MIGDKWYLLSDADPVALVMPFGSPWRELQSVVRTISRGVGVPPAGTKSYVVSA